MRNAVVLQINQYGGVTFGWPDVPGIRNVVQVECFDIPYLLIESDRRTLNHDELFMMFLDEMNLPRAENYKILGKGIVAIDASNQYAAFANKKEKQGINIQHLKQIKSVYPEWSIASPSGNPLEGKICSFMSVRQIRPKCIRERPLPLSL